MPIASFVVAVVREDLPKLPLIDVLFCRRDSPGEGGSGVFVLGDSILLLMIESLSERGWPDHF